MSHYDYTIGLNVRDESRNEQIFAKVCFYYEHTTNTVRMIVESAWDLKRLQRYGTHRISYDEYINRPHDYFDDVVEARWAFDKFGLTV